MKTTSWLLALPLVAVSCCCGGGTGSTSTTGSVTGGGSSTGGSGGNGWTIVPLDTSDGGDQSDLALAVGPGDVVGVAYYLIDSADAGPVDFQPYQIRYVQYANGTVTPPSIIDSVAHPQYDLGLAIQASGVPAVAYLGGASYGTGAAASLYWLQSQAIVAYQNGSTWTLQVANNAMGNPLATTANGGPTDYMVMGMPIVVGLYSQIGFDSHGVAYDFYRDVNFGQSIGTSGDFASSDVEGEVGGPTTWNLEWAFAGNTWNYNGTPALGLGGHNQLVMANDEPAIVCDEFDSSAGDDSSGQNVDFMMRLAATPASDWSVPQRILTVGDTQTGPSMAWDSTFGYAVAVYDTDSTKLLYTSSKDGVTWQSPDDVYAGSGGWFPSIAINPLSHQPTIADFLCSNESGLTAIQQCPKQEQQIEVRSATNGAFAPAVAVDPAGGYQPKIGYLSTGKMVIAYRQLPSYDLVLAVQQ